eukprot:Nitzschia sp. Nitz4//scaffold185_size43419//4739//5914//NITZ4_007293-RA/size43419-processed-gene-0.67-mRNA-1//1//CDS//3329539685//4338//frame0
MNTQQDPYRAVPTHTDGLRNTSSHSRSLHGGEDADDYDHIRNTSTTTASTSHSPYLSQSRESRPLTSFDDEEEDDSTPHASGAPSGGTGAAPAASIPPRTSILSWDDSDSDEDDTYANIKRYAIDFSHAAAATDEEYSSHHEDSFHRTSSDPSNTHRHSSLFQYMQHQFQVVRQQARQRRAQLLLQQSDRNWRQSTYYCWMTACDATDTGIFLVLVGIGIWLLLLWLWEEHRSDCWIVGTLLLVLRFSGRPCAAFLQRQQRRLSRMMILRQRSSSTASMHQHHAHSSTPSSLGMRSMASSPGRYNQIPAYTDHHQDEHDPQEQQRRQEQDVQVQLEEDYVAGLDNPSTTVLVASNSLGNVELADMMELTDEALEEGLEHGMMGDDPTIHTV